MAQKDFIVFESGKLPVFEGIDNMAVFHVINAGYVLKGKQHGFREMSKEHFTVNEKTKLPVFIRAKSAEYLDKITLDKPLSGLKLGYLGEKSYLLNRFFEKLGGRALEISPGGQTEFDITFSSCHFDQAELKKSHGNTKIRALLDYAELANQTRAGGYSINAAGSYVSTLYNLFFQVIGFEVADYFRIGKADNEFTIILRKLNRKKTTQEETEYLYSELKHRNPIRYM